MGIGIGRTRNIPYGVAHARDVRQITDQPNRKAALVGMSSSCPNAINSLVLIRRLTPDQLIHLPSSLPAGHRLQGAVEP